jgi:hypothetical protein
MRSIAVSIALMLLAGCSSSPPVQPDAGATATPAASPAPSPTPAEKKPHRRGDKEIRCVLANDERILMLEPNPPGCEVYYTLSVKPDPKIVATSKKGMKFCEGVLEKMQKNLVAAGFVCK